MGTNGGPKGQKFYVIHDYNDVISEGWGNPGTTWGRRFRVVSRQTPIYPQSTAPINFYYLDSIQPGEVTPPWA